MEKLFVTLGLNSLIHTRGIFIALQVTEQPMNSLGVYLRLVFNMFINNH